MPIPKGNGDITAIYTVYKSSPTSSTTTKQLIIRDTADVQFTNGRCGAPPPGTIIMLNEGFESQVATTTFPYNPISIPNWVLKNEQGTFEWTSRIFSGNKYAYMSAYSTTNTSVHKSWLVTNGLNMDANTDETLTFDTKQDFYLNTSGVPVPSTFQVLVSTNYSGTGDPFAAGVTWEVPPTVSGLPIALSPGSTTGNFPASYTPSGAIDLSGYTGTLRIAFVYTGSSPNANSAWELDNIRVLGL